MDSKKNEIIIFISRAFQSNDKFQPLHTIQNDFSRSIHLGENPGNWNVFSSSIIEGIQGDDC
jgi:hypothetical protein